MLVVLVTVTAVFVVFGDFFLKCSRCVIGCFVGGTMCQGLGCHCHYGDS